MGRFASKPALDMPDSRKVRQKLALQRSATTIALVLVSALGLIVSAALTPQTLVDIEKTALLKKADGLTQGRVVAHNVLQQKYTKRNSSLTVAYAVDGIEFQTYARGDAALPEVTPIGSRVNVHYLTANPAISEVVAEGLRPERYSWLSFTLMWGLSIFGLILSAISYKHLVGPGNNAGRSLFRSKNEGP